VLPAVLAPNITLAKEFYRSVFDWRFKPTPPPNSEDELAMFSYPDDAFKDLDGGIVKIDGDRKIRSERGTIVYLYAHDIEEMIAVRSFLHKGLRD
jgi:predicted enzyme related to lactoylglutathione lyase